MLIKCFPINVKSHRGYRNEITIIYFEQTHFTKLWYEIALAYKCENVTCEIIYSKRLWSSGWYQELHATMLGCD